MATGVGGADRPNLLAGLVVVTPMAADTSSVAAADFGSGAQAAAKPMVRAGADGITIITGTLLERYENGGVADPRIRRRATGPLRGLVWCHDDERWSGGRVHDAFHRSGPEPEARIGRTGLRFE